MLAAALAPALAVVAASDASHAAPGARYRVGSRVRAKRTCTVQGYAVKRGVVLAVVAVQADDAGKLRSVDLALSGRILANVPVAGVDGPFTPA